MELSLIMNSPKDKHGHLETHLHIKIFWKLLENLNEIRKVSKVLTSCEIITEKRD